MKRFRSGPGTIDLLITDVVMPGIDGPALAESLCSENPKLPVLFISGFPGGHKWLLDAPKGWHYRFLAKPFGPKQLAENIGKLLHTVITATAA